MARRPDIKRHKALKSKALKSHESGGHRGALGRGLALLSPRAVRDFYERTYQQCRINDRDFPSARAVFGSRRPDAWKIIFQHQLQNMLGISPEVQILSSRSFFSSSYNRNEPTTWFWPRCSRRFDPHKHCAAAAARDAAQPTKSSIVSVRVSRSRAETR